MFWIMNVTEVNPKVYSKIKLPHFWNHNTFTVSWKSSIIPALTALLSLVSWFLVLQVNPLLVKCVCKVQVLSPWCRHNPLKSSSQYIHCVLGHPDQREESNSMSFQSFSTKSTCLSDRTIFEFVSGNSTLYTQLSCQMFLMRPQSGQSSPSWMAVSLSLTGCVNRQSLSFIWFPIR